MWSPHVAERETHQRPQEFSSVSPKRLLQHHPPNTRRHLTAAGETAALAADGPMVRVERSVMGLI